MLVEKGFVLSLPAVMCRQSATLGAASEASGNPFLLQSEVFLDLYCGLLTSLWFGQRRWECSERCGKYHAGS
jgi:hypothetical protein